MATSTKPITSLAQVVEKLVRNIKNLNDVSFSSIAEGSLCQLVSIATKKKNSTQRRDYLKWQWDKGTLKEEVEKIRSSHSTLAEISSKIFLRGGCASEDISKSLFKKYANSGFGSCFYKALSQAFFGVEEEYLHLRNIIVDYVFKNFETVKSDYEFYNKDDYDIYNTPSKYRREHLKSTTFATQFEVFIFVKIFNIPVRVVQDHFDENKKKDYYQPMMQVPPDNVENPDDCLHLRYSGTYDNGHFEFLENLNSPNTFCFRLSEAYFFKNCLLKKSCKLNQKYVQTIPSAIKKNDLKETPLIPDDNCINWDDLDHSLYENGFLKSYMDNLDTEIDNSNSNLIGFCNENNSNTVKVLNDDHISSFNIHKKSVDDLTDLKSLEQLKIFEDTNNNDQKEIDSGKKKFDLSVHGDTPVSGLVDDFEGIDCSSQGKDNIFNDSESKSKCEDNNHDTDDDDLKDGNCSKCEDNNHDTDDDDLKDGNCSSQPDVPPDKNKDKGNLSPTDRTKYPYYVGEVSFLIQSVVVNNNQMNIELLRKVIKEYMRTDLRCRCPLSFYGGFRFNSTNTVGYAYCNVRSHGAKYIFQVVERDGQYIQVDVSCNMEKQFQHKAHEQPFTRIRGERRRQVRQLCETKCPRDIYLSNCSKSAEELQKNNYTDKECNQHVIQKINSERKAMGRRKIENSDIQDFTQTWIDEQTLKDNYVRELKFPLSILLFTERQLQAIDPSIPAVLHLDSTGANLRIPKDLHCKRVYYYALVYRATKSTIPLAQMVTCQQDESSITHFLEEHNKIVIKNFATSPIKAVVTDWSWPSMHSILSTYNNGMDISKYLKLTYEYYIDPSKKPKKITFLLSCCAHIMHRVAIEIEDLDLGHMKIFLMKCMGKLILCRDKKTMDATFKLIAMLLLTKNKATAEKTVEKFEKLSDDESDLDINNLLEEVDKINSEKSGYQRENLIQFKTTNSIYSQSPFYIYFFSLVEQILNLLRLVENDSTEITNIYYSPEFLNYLLTFFMPYASLWSGIVLDLIDPKISRVSNAYVESHNKSYKEKILEGRKDLAVGEAIRAMRAYIECLLQEEYLFQLRVDETQEFFKYPPTKDAAADHSSSEIWARSKKEFDKVKPKKTRARYIGNSNFINVQKKVSADDHESENKLNNDNETKKRNRKQNVKCKNEPIIKRNKSNTVSFTESPTALKFLENGMIDDLKYYLASNSKKIRLAHYTANERTFFRDREFYISPFDLHSVADYNEWVSHDLIDAFASAIMVDWRDITYIPSYLLQRVFGRLSGMKLDNKLAIHTHNQEIGKKLLSVYCHDSHWRVLMVDIELKQLILLDPRSISTDINRIKGAFTKLLEDCVVLSPLRTLKTIDWTINDGPRTRPFQPQNDTSNCGVYCMYYLQCIYEQKPFDKNFNPEEYREKIARQLILRADDMQERCLYCAKTIESGTITIKCNICKREIHENCKANGNDESEHENNFEKSTKRSRKKQKKIQPTSNLSAFTCNLCKLYNA